jgi:hypothetical protein
LYAESEARFKWVPKVTAGLVFLGTPFRGTKLQFTADFFAKLMQPMGSHRGILKELDFDDAVLRDKTHNFCRLYVRLSIPVCCCFELYDTDYGRRFGVGGIAKGMVRNETLSLGLALTSAGGGRAVRMHSGNRPVWPSNRSLKDEQIL